LRAIREIDAGFEGQVQPDSPSVRTVRAIRIAIGANQPAGLEQLPSRREGALADL